MTKKPNTSTEDFLGAALSPSTTPQGTAGEDGPQVGKVMTHPAFDSPAISDSVVPTDSSVGDNGSLAVDKPLANLEGHLPPANTLDVPSKPLGTILPETQEHAGQDLLPPASQAFREKTDREILPPAPLRFDDPRTFDDAPDLLEAVKRAARNAGIPRSVVTELEHRLRKQLYQPELLTTEAVRPADLTDIVGDRAKKVVEAISPQDIALASLKDKAIAAGILIEKWKLMRGEPTQLVAIEDRTRLDDLMVGFLAEAKRRGLAIDTNPVTLECQVINAEEEGA